MDVNEAARACLEQIINVIHEHRQQLTDLDAAIGDADHGSNMDRGFQAVREKLATAGDVDVATLLKTVATTLIGTVGGASGPLYGTGFLRAGTVLTGKENLTLVDAVTAFDAFVNGVVQRGKASTHEKTMVDALIPAQTAFKQAVSSGDSPVEAFAAAATAAEQGVQQTIPMLATKGRASYLGNRSIGHQDPGATSTALILRAIADTLAKQ